MGELPPLDSIAAALLFVGLLFGLRYFLAMRRLKAGAPDVVPSKGPLKAPEAGAYGEAMEPNRRYAVRQYWQAVIFFVSGVVLFGWVLATGMPITLGQGV